MKGVSEIIAIILILMIVIALAALAYTWFSGIFSSLTATAGTSVTQSTNAMATQFKIENAKWVAASSYTDVTIRNTGTQAINSSVALIAFFIDGTVNPIASFNGGTPVTCVGCSGVCPGANCMIQPGSVAEYRPTTALTYGCGTSVIKVTATNGQSDSRTISC